MGYLSGDQTGSWVAAHYYLEQWAQRKKMKKSKKKSWRLEAIPERKSTA